MPGANADRPLHGGAARVVALAVRSLGYRAGVAVLVDDDQVRRTTWSGPDDERLVAAATDVVAGRGTSTEVVSAPLHDPSGAVIGALCLVGPSRDADPEEDRVVLGEYAAVLDDQLDLLRQLGPPPDPAAQERLVRGLDGGEIQAWFQPLVRLDDEAVIGFEALARWVRGDGEVVRPGDFIPVAEQSGLVGRLDLAVLADAVGHLAGWHRTRPDLRLSVNVSGRHLDDPTWVEDVHAVVSAAGVRPDRIELELTESVRPTDVLRSVEELRRARALGYQVWFDDFGTGWSELRQLVELPVDGVKVDRFFTEALGGRGDSVVRAMVQIARDLDLDTVIEGVSRPEHADRARALGCRLGQGFLWSPAVPAHEVPALLESGVAVRAAGR